MPWTMPSNSTGNGLSFLRQAASKWHLLGLMVSLFSPGHSEVVPGSACNALRDFDFSYLNTTILSAVYFENATEVGTLGVCRRAAQVSEPLCRVQFLVNTSSVSAITAEAWLPKTWSGRLLALGNGGLGGCIDYDNLEYGSSLGFASVASNNGHDGNSGAIFANNSEVLADFTSRSVHLETVVGKELLAVYYERPPRRSYYMGCSTGGRQGIYAALHYPSDFDGILAGAPATNFNRLLGWSGMITKYLGAPYGNESASHIPMNLWDMVVIEALRQCDGLDGVIDGIISEPDSCDFRPEELLCEGRIAENCLTRSQVEALRKVYSPVYGQDGEPLFPRFDPGAEGAIYARSMMLSGQPHPYAYDWMKYVVDNDPNYNYSQFGLADIERMQALDPGNISTFNGDLSSYRARGGRIITYHGRSDNLIPSGNAKALYNLIARTLGLRPATLDEFYRLFLVPGMDHCIGGKGATQFGQDKGQAFPITQKEENDAQNSFKTLEEQPTNILLALVDWVENGHVPDTIVGISENGLETRAHCRYPMKTQWNGERWVCSKEVTGIRR